MRPWDQWWDQNPGAVPDQIRTTKRSLNDSEKPLEDAESGNCCHGHTTWQQMPGHVAIYFLEGPAEGTQALKLADNPLGTPHVGAEAERDRDALWHAPGKPTGGRRRPLTTSFGTVCTPGRCGRE